MPEFNTPKTEQRKINYAYRVLCSIAILFLLLTAFIGGAMVSTHLYFVNNSNNNLKGYKLDIPEEITTVVDKNTLSDTNRVTYLMALRDSANKVIKLGFAGTLDTEKVEYEKAMYDNTQDSTQKINIQEK